MPSTLENLGPIFLPDPVDPSHPLNVGRVAWWIAVPGLDGGRQWFDLMGRYHGTLTGMTTSASGWRGTTRPGGWGHLLFDGVDDRVATAVPMVTNHTVGAWVRLDAASNYPVVTSGFSNAGSSFEMRFNQSSGQPEYNLNDANVATSPTALALGTWHRIVATSDGVTLRLYVDGRQAASTGSAAVAANPEFRSIGARWSPALYLQGAIDDVTIAYRTWSAAEARADFDLGPCGYQGALNRMGLMALAGTAAAGAAFSPAWAQRQPVLGLGIY